MPSPSLGLSSPESKRVVYQVEIELPNGFIEEWWSESERPGYWKRFESALDPICYVIPEGKAVQEWRSFYCMYIEDNGGVKVIHFMFSDESNSRDEEPKSFRKVIATRLPASWSEFQSLLRIHLILAWNALNNIESHFESVDSVICYRGFKPLKLVDHILAESFGVLLWQHQFESLYRIVKHDHVSDIMRIYRAYFCGEPGIAEIFSKEVCAGTTLYDVITERMIFGGISHRDTKVRELALLAPYVYFNNGNK